jgi:hypothetical protein
VMLLRRGSSATFSSDGISDDTFPANAAVVLLGKRPPTLFTIPRTALIN